MAHPTLKSHFQKISVELELELELKKLELNSNSNWTSDELSSSSGSSSSSCTNSDPPKTRIFGPSLALSAALAPALTVPAVSRHE